VPLICVVSWGSGSSRQRNRRSETRHDAAATLGPQVEEWRAAGALGDVIEVPADSDPQTRLLAMVGRRAGAPARLKT